MMPTGCCSKTRFAVLHEVTRASRVWKSGQFCINASRISVFPMIEARTLRGRASLRCVGAIAGWTALESRAATSDCFALRSGEGTVEKDASWTALESRAATSDCFALRSGEGTVEKDASWTALESRAATSDSFILRTESRSAVEVVSAVELKVGASARTETAVDVSCRRERRLASIVCSNTGFF